MRSLAALAHLVLMSLGAAGVAGGAESWPPGFIQGDYAVVGREPDGGAAYAGRARIALHGDRFTLSRRLDGGTAEALVGAVEDAAGGDVRVVRFRGPAARPRTMTCLVHSDLDNEGRLTCVWTYDGAPDPKEPGLEAFFATAAWPDAAPDKRSER